MNTVLVVDDDAQILRALRINLSARGYEVITAPDGASALRTAAEEHPDAVVLDLDLPDLDGTDVIAGLRGWTPVPIIVLSARTDAADKIDALDAGADDYVTKPFGMAELLARLRAALRRAQTSQVDGDPVVATETFSVDLSAKRVVRAGTEVHLTPTEWGILEQLVRNQGKLVAQQQLPRGRYGGRPTPRRPTTCGSTWPNCAASSRWTRPTPATSSPKRVRPMIGVFDDLVSSSRTRECVYLSSGRWVGARAACG